MIGTTLMESSLLMAFEHKTGDIFDTKLPAIGHGVNLYGVMGAGIAKAIATVFPQVLNPYKEACKTKQLTPGTMQYVQVQDNPTFYILNLASQDRPGKHARLEWVESSLEAAILFCKTNNLEGFAVPRIGARIGGLAWEDVKEILERVALQEPDVLVEIWSLPNADD